MTHKAYAGIGSRNIPISIKVLFKRIAYELALDGYTLRSGHAGGSDMNFEEGCDYADGRKEIYLPWNRFNNSDSKLIVEKGKAYEIAERFHPYWYNLSEGAKSLQARNSHQILGWDLETPVRFVICYTKNGEMVGGTAQALRIANHYNIPIFNAGKYDDIQTIKKEFNRFIKEGGFIDGNITL